MTTQFMNQVIPGDDGAVRLRGDGGERDEHDAGVARLVEDAEVGDLAVEEDGDDVEVAVRDRVVQGRVAVDVSQVDHPGGCSSIRGLVDNGKIIPNFNAKHGIRYFTTLQTLSTTNAHDVIRRDVRSAVSAVF